MTRRQLTSSWETGGKEGAGIENPRGHVMEMRGHWEAGVAGREFPSGMYCVFPANGDEWDQLRGRQVGWVGPKGGVWRPLPEWRPPSPVGLPHPS